MDQLEAIVHFTIDGKQIWRQELHPLLAPGHGLILCGYASINQWHSPSVHFSMKHFRIFFIIDSGDTTGFHLVMSMWNTLYPSFGGITLMPTTETPSVVQ
jgi:hypothetical protein